MSNYLFKGISISSIITGTGDTTIVNYYTGFPATALPGKNMMKPLPLGYTITSNSEDVSNYCTANYTDYTTVGDTGIIPPADVKKFRCILVGGGGAGSGGSGNATAQFINESGPFQYSNRSGTNGRNGSNSKYVISNSDINIKGNTIWITIGAGGSRGGAGGSVGNASARGAGKTATATGGTGGNGEAGKSTTLEYLRSKLTSPGGSGGNAPNAAVANASGTETGGTNSTQTSPAPTDYSIPADCPSLGNTYGAGGAGGPLGGAGSSGQPGICRIIWLYD
jgi:hypothetical protein